MVSVRLGKRERISTISYNGLGIVNSYGIVDRYIYVYRLEVGLR